MNIQLTVNEARVIGALIEKERTTPDQYPLSLHALTAACNQKSSREPVMNLDEGQVKETLDNLIKKRLVSEKTGFGSRVAKYQHRFCNTDFGDLKLSEQELGIICVLLLRGPQTPGELRIRTERLCGFNDVHETEAVLNNLIDREDGPFVVRLPREAGKREPRYAHLFSGDVEVVQAVASDDSEEISRADHGRMEELEKTVEALREEIEAIKQRLDRMSPDGQGN
ncbi:MAG: YceH family protein [Gammaproteobacteria bacterium]